MRMTIISNVITLDDAQYKDISVLLECIVYVIVL